MLSFLLSLHNNTSVHYINLESNDKLKFGGCFLMPGGSTYVRYICVMTSFFPPFLCYRRGEDI